MLQDSIYEYQKQLKMGVIQKAYKGIMTSLSGIRSHLEKAYPDFSVSALYFGYMDMSYFAFTPPALKDKNLKIAIVYLHEQGRFDIWLSGGNRKIQKEWVKRLKNKDLGEYALSLVEPGIDSIVEGILVSAPDFDDLTALAKQIEDGALVFVEKMKTLTDE